MAEQVKLEVTADASKVPAAADKAFKRMEDRAAQANQKIANEAKKVQATDTGSYYGPAARPRFDAQERAVRDAVAGRIRGMRDQAQREQFKAEVDRRLYGETTTPTPNRAMRETPNRSRYEQDVRDATAARLRAQRQERYQARIDAEVDRATGSRRTPLSDVRRIFGGESSWTRRAQVLVGSGEVAVASQVGRELQRAAEGIREASELYANDMATSGELVEKAARSLPVLGGFVAAGRESRAAIDNIWMGRGWAKDSAALAADMATAARARRENAAAAGEREATAAAAASLAARRGLANRFDPVARAGMRGDAGAVNDIQRRLAEAEIARDDAMRQAQIAQRESEREIRNYEKANIRSGMAPTEEADVRKRIQSMRAESAAKIANDVEAANQEYLAAQRTFAAQSIEIERSRTMKMQEMAGQSADARQTAQDELQTKSLRAAGRESEAELAELTASYGATARRIQMDFSTSTRDLDRMSEEYRRRHDDFLAAIRENEANRQLDTEVTRRRQLVGAAGEALRILGETDRAAEIVRGSAGGENRAGGRVVSIQETALSDPTRNGANISQGLKQIQDVIREETNRIRLDIGRILQSSGIKINVPSV